MNILLQMYPIIIPFDSSPSSPEEPIQIVKLFVGMFIVLNFLLGISYIGSYIISIKRNEKFYTSDILELFTVIMVMLWALILLFLSGYYVGKLL